jgi:hypothetical protein
MRTHLFVAAETAFGEAVLGTRIAHELHARGDRIVFLAGERLSVLTEGSPFGSILVPHGEHKNFDAMVMKAADRERADSIVLLDATLVYWLLMQQKSDTTFVRKMKRPIIGLDAWNVRVTGFEWDVCGTTWHHSKHSLEVTRRIVPVPFAKPTGVTGLYNALPEPIHIDEDDREDVRADHDVGDKDRLVLLTSAVWQQHTSQPHEAGRRLSQTMPALADELLARLGPRVRVLHVGPEAYAMPKLGSRYTWLSQRTPPRFARLLGSADALVSFNFSATTITTAVASGLPVLLGINSYSGTSAEVASRLPRPPSPAIRAWLDHSQPISAYRVWPLGLSRYLAPLIEGNPYTATTMTREVLEEESFVEGLRTLLFDDRTREDLRKRQAAYVAEVSKLPRAADLVNAYLDS